MQKRLVRKRLENRQDIVNGARLGQSKLMINTNTTVIVAGFPKPEKSSDCGTIPNILAANSAPSATMS